MTETLLPTDVVGGSFWLLAMAMSGAAIFFLLERKKVADRWHTTMVLLESIPKTTTRWGKGDRSGSAALRPKPEDPPKPSG